MWGMSRDWVSMGRVGIAASIVLGAVGCGFDSTGSGQSTEGPPGASTGETTEQVPDDTPPATTSGPAGSSTTDHSASGGESSSGAQPGTAVVELPLSVDFGSHGFSSGAVASETLQVVNTGTDVAYSIDIPPLPSPFSVVGDDCPQALEPEQSCTVTVRFDPGSLGPFEGMLRVNYQKGAALAQATSPILALSTGTLTGLVDNPGAEFPGTPPPSWHTPLGTAWTSEAPNPHSGTRAFVPGASLPGVPTTLEQVLDVSVHIPAIRTQGMELEVSGFLLGEDDGFTSDIGQIFVRYLDGPTVLAEHSAFQPGGSNWQPLSLHDQVPPQTRQIVVGLQCTVVGASAAGCAVTFDDLSVVLRYE